MHAIVHLIDHKSMGVKDVENLDKAIRAHAMLYKAAWPSRLRPKLHFLTHFPLEVLLCGLARHYCMVLCLRAQEHGHQARC